MIEAEKPQADEAATRTRRAGVPVEFAQRPMRALRPIDATSVYAHPRTQLARLEKLGLLHRLGTGYFVVVPQERVGMRWRPDLETAAAAIAAAAVGPDQAVLMGLSAARVHHAIPRALAAALVAVPERRRPVELTDRDGATVQFVQRDTSKLDAERTTTDLGGCLATTVEQTVLDLAHRPTLGHAEPEAWAAIAALWPRCDTGRLAELATEQRLGAALERARAAAER